MKEQIKNLLALQNIDAQIVVELEANKIYSAIGKLRSGRIENFRCEINNNELFIDTWDNYRSKEKHKTKK